jgi:hypothetical protein
MRWSSAGCLGSKDPRRCRLHPVLEDAGGGLLRQQSRRGAIQQDPEVTDTDTDRPAGAFSTRRTSLPGLEVTRPPETLAQYPLG